MATQIGTFIKNISPIKSYLQDRSLKARFGNEVALASGQSRPRSDHQSILFFTTHKCASVYVGEILSQITQNVRLIPINLESYYAEGLEKSPKKLTEKESQAVARFFAPKGYYYGPLRLTTWPIENIDSYKVLVMLRDPRDVLTSLYFSMAYSHVIYKNALESKMMNNREQALAQPIDEWIHHQAQLFLPRYQYYIENLIGQKNTCLVRYEDMVGNFETWLNTILTGLNLTNVSDSLKQKIIGEANFDVEENVASHKRQVQPGDHKRKLQAETIQKLNETFSSILETLGYEK